MIAQRLARRASRALPNSLVTGKMRNSSCSMTDNPPTGAGEDGVPVVACAVGNAIAALTGERPRELPFASERVRWELSGFLHAAFLGTSWPSPLRTDLGGRHYGR